jgi:hypothetical protein
MRWTNDQPSLHYPISRPRRIATDYIRPIPDLSPVTHRRERGERIPWHAPHSPRYRPPRKDGAVLEIMLRGFPSFAARCGKGGLTTQSSGGNIDTSNPGEPPSDEPEFCCAHDRYRNHADSYSLKFVGSPLHEAGANHLGPRSGKTKLTGFRGSSARRDCRGLWTSMYWYRRVTTCCDKRASLRQGLTFRRFATLPTTVNQTATRHERRLSTAFTTVGLFIAAPILLAPSLDDDTAAADDDDDAGQYLWHKLYYEYTRGRPTTSRHGVTQFPARAGLRPITFGKNPRSITGHPSSGAPCASSIAPAP